MAGEFLNSGASRSELLAALMDKQNRRYSQQQDPSSIGEALTRTGSRLVDAYSQKKLVDDELKRREELGAVSNEAMQTFLTGSGSEPIIDNDIAAVLQGNEIPNSNLEKRREQFAIEQTNNLNNALNQNNATNMNEVTNIQPYDNFGTEALRKNTGKQYQRPAEQTLINQQPIDLQADTPEALAARQEQYLQSQNNFNAGIVDPSAMTQETMDGIDNVSVANGLPQEVIINEQKIPKKPTFKGMTKEAALAAAQIAGLGQDDKNFFYQQYIDIQQKEKDTAIKEAEEDKVFIEKAIPAYNKLESGLYATDQIIKQIDTLKTHSGRKAATGFGSNYFTIGGTDAASFESDLLRLQAETALSSLIAAKAQGATFGALSNEELDLLKQKMGNLRISQKDDDFLSSLNELYTDMVAIRGQIQSAYSRQYQNRSGQVYVPNDVDLENNALSPYKVTMPNGNSSANNAESLMDMYAKENTYMGY
tara:strand:+ start:127 stop:1560 length:1434 start_codon:yes stop_codon:yes gene_type:complete